MKTLLKFYIFVAVIIILYSRISLGTLERVERFHEASEKPFMFESTGMALGVLSSATNSSSSNWGQGMALVISPVALLALPATLIADTVSLPYDYYLYKQTKPQFAFWRKASKQKSIDGFWDIPLLKDFSSNEKAEYEKYYGEYSAYFIHMKIRHSVGPKYIHPNKILLLYRLATSHPEYKYSPNILRDISGGAHDLDNKTIDKFYYLTSADIETYKGFIVSMIKGDLNRDDQQGFAEKYYHIVLSEKKLKKDTRLAILEALEKTYKRNNRYMKVWLKDREEHLKNEVKIGNGDPNEVTNRMRWLKGLKRVNEEIKNNQAGYEKLEKRLVLIRKAIFVVQGIEFIQYTQIQESLPKIKFKGVLIFENSCIKLKMKNETVTVIFPSSFNLNFLNGYSVIQKGKSVLALIKSNSFLISDSGYITSSIGKITVSPLIKCISDKYLIVGENFGQSSKTYLGNITK